MLDAQEVYDYFNQVSPGNSFNVFINFAGDLGPTPLGATKVSHMLSAIRTLKNAEVYKNRLKTAEKELKAFTNGRK